MQPFTQRVLEILKAIPPGSVMTYGQVAAWAGSPRGARQVVRILHSMSESHDLPWHRVVNAEGRISLLDPDGAYTQRMLLGRDGVDVTPDGCIDLDRYRYSPSASKGGTDV
ncbi:MGMT family protein [Gorillibacterium sp. CAU 1737]|uniref:MGMT family protein n=1 Tax=Gorillibacterium sp. CAU 1737 TaxID=3140362 RepID=UPI00326194B7